MIFHASLGDYKYLQVSSTLLSILANLQTVLWSGWFWFFHESSITPEYLPKTFRNHSKVTNYHRFHRRFGFPQFFQLSSNVKVLIYIFHLFYCHCTVNLDKFFSSCILTRSPMICRELGYPFAPKNFMHLILLEYIMACA